ncbi:family 78 glycoside hydrolase catalytic domain [Lentilactobacillus raoultii]|uniref:alpha-L-rhamnosidase n=1 Tax=Lentilactobacillus raoultii TaxID=1987503 RepID=A0ABW3PF57_9LACO|nr:family 78 glycoside hydrolase catalytic domain [Lentilactobacillus raoultii]
MQKRFLAIFLGVFFSVVGLISINVQASAESSVSTFQQTLNLMTHPYGIDQQSNPSFSWAMSDSINGSQQTAYEIQIMKGNPKTNPVIDTGWVNASLSNGVHIKKINRLSNNQLYYWQVRVKDNHGQASQFSTPQAFTTKTSWQSTNMIWALKKGTKVPADFIFARKAIDIKDPQKIQKAIVSVTGRSNTTSRQFIDSYFVNNHFVGEGPARNNQKTYYYNNYDITKYLRAGRNMLGAINYANEDQGFLSQLTIYYKDGTKKILANSGQPHSGWQVMDGTKAFGENDLMNLGTFYYKAAAENLNQKYFPVNWNKPTVKTNQRGWTTPFNDGQFLGPDQSLVSYPSENVKRHVLKPTSVIKKGNGHYLIDFGREIIGSFGLKNLRMPHASEMEIRYGEELAKGAVKYPMRTTNNYDEYWTLKSGNQTLANTDLLTYRYVEISNCPADLTKNNVEGLALRQPFDDQAASFESSDSRLNQLYGLSKYTIKATNQDLMVDSQSRERGVYEGDTLINSLASYAVESQYSMPRFSTLWGINNPTWPAEYGFFSVMNAWNDYQYTGDKSLLIQVYEQLKKGRNNLFMNQIDANGLIKNDNTTSSTMNAVLMDWPQSERDDYVFGDYDTVFNAIGYGAYSDMAKIAHVLGKTKDQEQYSSLAENVKQGMMKVLYNSKSGEFRDSENTDHASEHAQAFPLAFGIVDNSDITHKLTQVIDNRGDEFHTSIFDAYFVLKGLYEGNNSDQAVKLLNSNGLRSWGHVLNDLHATITPEAWDPSLKPNMTFSHPWGSAPITQIVSGMFGIKPLKPGFKEFQIKLQPGTVSRAAIKVPTIKGTILVAYQKTGSKLSVKVTVPANTHAIVYLPTMGSSVSYTKIELTSGNHDLSN